MDLIHPGLLKQSITFWRDNQHVKEHQVGSNSPMIKYIPWVCNELNTMDLIHFYFFRENDFHQPIHWKVDGNTITQLSNAKILPNSSYFFGRSPLFYYYICYNFFGCLFIYFLIKGTCSNWLIQGCHWGPWARDFSQFLSILAPATLLK